MANAGPNTNGSQFFICHQDLTGRLPKNYTIFGQVTKGMDVVDAIVSAPRNAKDLPDEPGGDHRASRSTRTETPFTHEAGVDQGVCGPGRNTPATNVKEFTSRRASKLLDFAEPDE